MIATAITWYLGEVGAAGSEGLGAFLVRFERDDGDIRRRLGVDGGSGQTEVAFVEPGFVGGGNTGANGLTGEVIEGLVGRVGEDGHDRGGVVVGHAEVEHLLAGGGNGHGAYAHIPFVGPVTGSEGVPAGGGKAGLHAESVADGDGNIHIEALHFSGGQSVRRALGIGRAGTARVQEGLGFVVGVGGDQDVTTFLDRTEQIRGGRTATAPAGSEHERGHNEQAGQGQKFLHFLLQEKCGYEQ